MTLKDVAVQAKVHTSLLHYYFEDKKAIFDAVFARRADVAANRRWRRSTNISPRMRRPRRSRASCAPISTPISASTSPAGTVGATMPRSVRRSRWRPNGGRRCSTPISMPVVLKLIDLLERALPGCPRDDIFWGYHFVTGALAHTLARTGRIDVLSGGTCRSTISTRSRRGWRASSPSGSRASAAIVPRRRRRMSGARPWNGRPGTKSILVYFLVSVLSAGAIEEDIGAARSW
ncbi:TetR/AcrR family transcriptional regulator [Sphingomonas sp. MMS24-JH45]